jgi:polysaccharide pyruvyl transferase WcaK-like protein
MIGRFFCVLKDRIKQISRRLIRRGDPSISDSGDLPVIIDRVRAEKDKTLVHVSAFNYGNAGDILLPIAVRDVWNMQCEGLAWTAQPVRPVVDSATVSKINRSRGLVVGGGGLFLKDTNANEISGWQWPCSVEMLEKVEVPLVLYAVGYNRFRGQDEFSPCFRENLAAFARKALYLGIRNSGSIECLKRYLPQDLHPKLRFQPCPTTFLSLLYPDICSCADKEDFVAVNTSFDRSGLRFGRRISSILDELAKTVFEVSKHHEIKFYAHMTTDEAFLPFLDAYGVKYEVVTLSDRHPRDIVKEYARPRLVIGMRGHAQMIPFGCNTPIVSVVSHEKMRWFLNDIKRPEWGADVLSDTFGDDLRRCVARALNDLDGDRAHISLMQRHFYEVSAKNAKDALDAMGCAR